MAGRHCVFYGLLLLIVSQFLRQHFTGPWHAFIQNEYHDEFTEFIFDENKQLWRNSNCFVSQTFMRLLVKCTFSKENLSHFGSWNGGWFNLKTKSLQCQCLIHTFIHFIRKTRCWNMSDWYCNPIRATLQQQNRNQIMIVIMKMIMMM